MALALPSLDDRTYDELVREAQRILPRRAPQWTDHNAHDPGITLIELFAWLVEQDSYRLDRTPDASVRAFLRLVGIEPLPPHVALTVVELMPQSGASPLDLPAGLPLTDGAGSITFETQTAVHLTAAQLVAIESDIGAARYEHTTENNRSGALYFPLSEQPEVGHALLLGFDAPLGTGGEIISLYLWSADPELDAETRRQLIEEAQRQHLDANPLTGGCNEAPTDWRQHYSARTVWEYLSLSGGWAALDPVEDETRALTLSGFVRFRVPADHAQGGGSSPALWIVRCRLLSGRYECPPVIDRIAVNASSAHHAAVRPTEMLGISQGHADEAFALENAPVVAGSTQLRVALDDRDDEPWGEVAQWDRVGAHDRAYRLDPERGQIEFGNGRVGRVPTAGAKLICSYRTGGGVEGNVAAGTLTHCAAAAVEVRQPFRAFGGAAAETLDDARGRALAFLAKRDRAITLDDFETLAISTPGVPVARARALAGYHPSLPCAPAAGNVTVVAVPSCPHARPEPGPDFLAAVYRRVAPRCALTTELHVIGPSYRVVAVHARLHSDAATDAAALRARAEAELNRFLHPLEGGPDAAGWPVGRAVYRSEVLAILNGIEGVAYVDRLSLVLEGETDASCANVTLCPEELVAAGAHRLDVIAGRPPR